MKRQLGHADPGFTLRVYAHAMRFSEEESLVEGREWALSTTGWGADVATSTAITIEGSQAPH